MKTRNQKIWVLVKRPALSYDEPVAAFDNESAAYESHEAVQEEECKHEDPYTYVVRELPLRKNKLNAETIRKIVSGQ